MAADTDQIQADAEASPLIERGRYAVFQAEDGSWEIHRAGPLCEACASCGCGDQADPIGVPPMVVSVITGQAQLPGPVQAIMRKVTGNGK